MISNFLEAIKGKKTYALAGAAILYALAGAYLGKFGLKEAMDMVWVALTSAALRGGISAQV